MKPLTLLSSHPGTLRMSVAVVGFLAACLLLSFVVVLRGCMNEHYRPLGHGDITFAVSPRGDAIVFNAVGEGGRDLYRLDMATFRVARIAATPDYEVGPDISRRREVDRLCRRQAG